MKKSNGTTFGLYTVALAVAVLATASCGASREIQKEDKPLDPAIVIQDGPISIGAFGSGDRDDLEARGPRATAMRAELIRLESGLFQLVLSWTFEGAAPNSWRIRGFQEALDPYTSTLEFNEVVERGSESGVSAEFKSKPLARGRRYLYEFDAIVQEPDLNGSARIKTVTVDLRDAM